MPGKKSVFAFIDASNLFYGGEKSLGWRVDYQKLHSYLKKKYHPKKIFYYGGIELNGYPYSMLDKKALNLGELLRYLKKKSFQKKLSQIQLKNLNKYIQKTKFYMKLDEFGYILKLKPVKTYKDGNRIIKKANCDVDMTFDLMKYIKEYSGILILSGDGDFAAVLKYLKDLGKDMKILARGERTAREIKQLAGSDFRDFNYLREILKFRSG